MDAIQEYAQKYGRDEGNNFAVACFDQNSIAELEANQTGPADRFDIDEWKLSGVDEWRDAQKAAALALRRESEYVYN